MPTPLPKTIDGPSVDAASPTASDTVDETTIAKAFYIGTTGNLKYTTNAGTDVTLNNLPVGLYPIMVRRVWSTGTTAALITDMVLLF